MVTLLKQNGVFHNRLETLQNIINMATVPFQESLLGAEHLGKKQFDEFVENVCAWRQIMTSMSI